MRFFCTCAGSLGGGGGGGVSGAEARLACINLPELSRSYKKYHGYCSLRLDWSKFEEWPMFLLLNVLITLNESVFSMIPK